MQNIYKVSVLQWLEDFAMGAFIFWFVQVYVCLLPVTLGLTVYLEKNGRDNTSCISEDSKIACKSLPYIAQQLNASGIVENVTIVVATTLAETHFQNIENLRINTKYKSVSLKGGLTFTNISGLFLNLKKANGGKNRIGNHSVVIRIQRCRDVMIQDTCFQRSRETSIFFEDTSGNVTITNVEFIKNENFEEAEQMESHSGGIEILFTGNLVSNYYIENCIFQNNSAPFNFHSYDTTLRGNSEWRGQSAGGGLGIYFRGNSSRKTVVISNCNFADNAAIWGGGMHLMFQDQSAGNYIEIRNSSFIHNRAGHGGAGACIRYFKSESRQTDDDEDRYNVVYFHRVMFVRNTGDFGAGLLILSTYSPYPSTSKISFSSCEWIENEALYSSAVDIAPALFQRLDRGHLAVPEFIGCHVRRNILKSKDDQKFKLPFIGNKFSGIFVITKSIVYFSGEVSFESNSDSALYLNSGTVAFRSESDVVFSNNSGFRGGAIAIYGYSSVLINKNSSLLFVQNVANELGGAIYQHSFDQHDYKYGRMCFIRLEDPRSLSHNDTKTINITFVKNSASIMGMSIYSSTLYPCYFWNDHQLSTKRLDSDVLSFIGNISFDNEAAAIATNARNLNITNVLQEYKVIPGNLLRIPLISVNELDQEHENIKSYQVKARNGKIIIDRQFTIHGDLYISGTQGQNDILEIIQEAPRRVILHVNVTLVYCPPGFYHDSETLTCKCSLDEGNSSRFYYGISNCDMNEFHVSLHQGFWIGYIPPTTNHSPTNLFTAVCPLSFCKSDSGMIELTNDSELVKQICNEHRTGILCGDCLEGYSLFFHSGSFKCGNNSLCSLGFLFYFLSELVPVAILFSVIIILDFSFTSGEINGFILYSQILDSLLENIKTHNNYMVPSRIFYDIFNFDYFSTSLFSYCLWENAKVMDILVFKYVTVIFAFVLVVCLILIMNKVKWTKLEEKLVIKQRVSVINGISAFLVLCYAQCVRTSFYILTPVQLRTQGGISGNTVALFGGMPFLEGRHLFYSIIAILCIITIVAIPPLVLFLYPLTLHFLALCKLSEHWVVSKLLSILMINRFKPLIDSFQGCFRDRVRFFSGLYFLYRVMVLACFSIAHSTSQFFIVSQLLLTSFLGVHSIVQPYKKRSHNLIDSLIFLLLVLINACTIFISVYDVQYRENYFAGAHKIRDLFIAIQLVLIYLPMIVFISWLGIKAVKLFSKCVTLPKVAFKRHPIKSSAEEDIAYCLEYRQLTNIPLKDL